MVLRDDPSSAPETAHSERRRDSRKKVAVEIEMQSAENGTPLRTTTADLSTIGCYVETMFPLEVGSKVRIALWINDRKVGMEGIVITRDPQVGNGIEFTNMAAEDRLTLNQFLADGEIMKRAKELAAQIAVEQNREKFNQLVREMNSILDGLDKPGTEPTSN